MNNDLIIIVVVLGVRMVLVGVEKEEDDLKVFFKMNIFWYLVV